MVIAHNLMSLNATRMYGINIGLNQKSIEKLSSGYRVNRSADDAAGLAISEKMRTQIRGLNRASRNALDGISVIQTAEGAFGEMQDMLHRINELCTQAANDTNTDVDRKQIQHEIDQLVYEIDDTTDRTQFNTKQILAGVNKYQADGSVDHDAYGVPAKKTYYTAKDNLAGVFEQDIDETGRTSIVLNLGKYEADDSFGMVAGFGNITPEIEKAASNTYVDYASIKYLDPKEGEKLFPVIYGTAAKTPGNPIVSVDQVFDHLNTVLPPDDAKLFVRGLDNFEAKVRRDYGEDIRSVSFGFNDQGRRTLEIDTWADQNDPFKMMLQVGALPNQGIEVEIEHLNARGLGITGIFVDSYEDACAGMKKAQEAIDKVSTARANLGAQQNRLEHTIKNLDNIAENTQAAESRIRDTDMAKEMVEYSKSQILLQVGQAMISNAQRSNEGVLALLSA